LGLNFDQAGINNVMTHVMVLSVKVRRSERLRQTLGNGNTFKIHINFNSRNKITKKIYNPHGFYLPTWEKFVPPYTSPN
jgi:hypothetical protein